ncbi:KH domain-containing protein [bacterium]|nr:KH domain-containing protein [bacterium]MBU1599985.1 KH domain-containing protein [bacterium]MBU2462000.1 KH domain-containing protein [bacterium]
METEIEESTIIAQAVCEKIISLMGTEANVTAKRDDNEILVEINGEDVGMLIGREGKTLDSLQFIVSLIYARKSLKRKKVILDIAGYRKRQTDRLTDLAKRAADEASDTKSEVVLEPMPAYQRFAIHSLLQEDKRVTTLSQGEGEERQIVVIPNE